MGRGEVGGLRGISECEKDLMYHRRGAGRVFEHLGRRFEYIIREPQGHFFPSQKKDDKNKV